MAIKMTITAPMIVQPIKIQAPSPQSPPNLIVVLPADSDPRRIFLATATPPFWYVNVQPHSNASRV